jgi:hypothetical protein
MDGDRQAALGLGGTGRCPQGRRQAQFIERRGPELECYAPDDLERLTREALEALDFRCASSLAFEALQAE